MNKHSSKRMNRRQIAAAIVARSREKVTRHSGYVETIIEVRNHLDVSTHYAIHGVGEELEAESYRDGLKTVAVYSGDPVTITTQWHPHDVLKVDEPDCNCACDLIDARAVWRNSVAESIANSVLGV